MRNLFGSNCRSRCRDKAAALRRILGDVAAPCDSLRSQALCIAIIICELGKLTKLRNKLYPIDCFETHGFAVAHACRPRTNCFRKGVSSWVLRATRRAARSAVNAIS
jgi:hypothetical protein